MKFLLAVFFIMIALGDARAQTPDTFFEDFATSTSSGCSSQWQGDCLATWSSFGATGALSMSYAPNTTSGVSYGVYVEGTSSSVPNGVSYLFDVPSADPANLDVMIYSWALSSSVDATVTLAAFDSAMNPLGAFNLDLNQNADTNFRESFLFAASGQNPLVEYVQVTIGVYGSTELWINEVSISYKGGTPTATSEEECKAICEEKNPCTAQGKETTYCDERWHEGVCVLGYVCKDEVAPPENPELYFF